MLQESFMKIIGDITAGLTVCPKWFHTMTMKWGKACFLSGNITMQLYAKIAFACKQVSAASQLTYQETEVTARLQGCRSWGEYFAKNMANRQRLNQMQEHERRQHVLTYDYRTVVSDEDNAPCVETYMSYTKKFLDGLWPFSTDSDGNASDYRIRIPYKSVVPKE